MQSPSSEVFNSSSRQTFSREGKGIVGLALGLEYTVEYCSYVLCQKDLENARRK